MGNKRVTTTLLPSAKSFFGTQAIDADNLCAETMPPTTSHWNIQMIMTTGMNPPSNFDHGFIYRLQGRGLTYTAGVPARRALLVEGRCFAEILRCEYSNIYFNIQYLFCLFFFYKYKGVVRVCFTCTKFIII